MLASSNVLGRQGDGTGIHLPEDQATKFILVSSANDLFGRWVDQVGRQPGSGALFALDIDLHDGDAQTAGRLKCRRHNATGGAKHG